MLTSDSKDFDEFQKSEQKKQEGIGTKKDRCYQGQ